MMDVPLSLAIIGVCILLSGFFSGAETGIVSLNRLRLRHLAEGGLSRAKVLQELLKRPAELLAVLLVGNNIVLVVASTFATSLFEEHLAVATLLLSFLILVFGEIIPKGLFSQHADILTLNLATPIWVAYTALLPVTKIAKAFTSILVRPDNRAKPFMSRRELRLLLREGKTDGVVNGNGLEMLEAVLDLPTSRVKEVMTPRVDMVCIEESTGLEDILHFVQNEHYARIPVYRENIDRITGILYTKDLLVFLRERLHAPESMFFFRLICAKDLVHPPYFVPETMPLSRLLHEFRHKGIHMAIVVDEYGGTAGLVTLEDLLEEIVGEIHDEYDLGEESPYKCVEKGTYLVKAKTDITLLNEELGLNFPEGDFETIAGFVLERLGRIPLPGESIRFEGVTLTVIKADEKSISLIRIKKESEQ